MPDPSSLDRAPLRVDRLLEDAASRSYLQAARVAYVATTGADGWPYVVPMSFIYDGGPVLWFHNGRKPGHLAANLARDPRVCIAVGECGALVPGPRYACQSSLEYVSVVAFGRVEAVEDEATKNWFFDRMVEKYGPEGHRFPDPTYPLNHKIVLWRMTIEKLTGKQSAAGGH
ncbi:MAG: pyridoxamine 5'-phosphate oxidase family protein [Clostridia bacterium]|nr:pyridoxamine 5'-phosphate oxidase family protein [Clostridia bacterium]